MSLRRGFKAEADRYALDFRRRLNVSADGPLCPWRLAESLRIPVFNLSEIATGNSRVAYFLSQKGLWEFSGGTFSLEEKRLIVINDGHTKKRQASDLSHELSHCILKHIPTHHVSELGLRRYNEEQEAEANWLGPALLISGTAALSIARRSLSIAEASDLYSVTEQIVQMRLNLTGALKRTRWQKRLEQV
jgi:Zn-dependent peptidase ImmA (M78 family)